MHGPNAAAREAVSFPVWDAVVDLPRSAMADGTIAHGCVVDAVSRVRGASPDDLGGPAAAPGVTVWSFAVDRLAGDSGWPVRHASLIFAVRLAEDAGMSLRDAAVELAGIAASGGIAVDLVVGGQAESGRLFEVRGLGWLVSSTQPGHAFAASCYLVPPVVQYRLDHR
ncbi:hypothetical protein [Dactylosporangium sp. NPDC006015]|uniref:hypothetical protein n=1 Tax=Dactylosporangium sp. NPDC006015 TaxID=3154576 RepID=UPI0033A2C0BE